jgi:hypothetical protein
MEEIGLHIVFEEIKVRGSKNTQYLIRATEEGDGVEVNDTISVDSWEDCKKEYPTLQHILQDFSRSYNWEASWRDNDRMLFVESIQGHEGLYEFDSSVEYKCGTEIEEEKKIKTKSPKIKK